jgi:hypothetical protein
VTIVVQPEHLPALAARLFARVDKNGPIVRTELGPCWIWQGARDSRGYGKIYVGSEIDGRARAERCHRVAFLVTQGRWPIPAGRHRCDNQPCCRPEHIIEGTQAQNLNDMRERGRARRGDQSGEKSGRAKLTDKQVIEIRLATGTLREIANRYGVSRGHVWDIRHGRSRSTGRS